jgi:hypothetical protein
MPDRAYWTHKDCGQPVMFDHGGGFCLGCHAEGLDLPDLDPPAAPAEEEAQP